MSPVAISFVSLALVFGGSLLGMFLKLALPPQHFSTDAKDAVKLSMAMVATMAALVLGLLIASAKSSFDTQAAELTEMSSRIVLLDRVLAHFGPGAEESRNMLRGVTDESLDRIEPQRAPVAPRFKSQRDSERLYDAVQALAPKDDAQRLIQIQALNMVIALGQTRWLMYEQRTTSVSVPLLIVLIFWLIIIFISFGLFSPFNGTVVASLFVSALSVSGAIFLILEMYSPYGGLIQISSAPLRAALAQLGQ